MNWSDIEKREKIFLNLGGQGDCDPKPNYENYVCVDLEPKANTAVAHDLTKPIPLPDNSVDTILSEHFFEHIHKENIETLLQECFRILKPGSLLRIAVPDYHSPRNLKYLEAGHDPTHTDHLTLTTYPLLKTIVDASPFSDIQFYQYWDGNNFVYNEIDYSKGMIKRTCDNDPRNFRETTSKKILGKFRDFAFLLSKGFIVTRNDMLVQRGHPLRMTSIVIDLIKR